MAFICRKAESLESRGEESSQALWRIGAPDQTGSGQSSPKAKTHAASAAPRTISLVEHSRNVPWLQVRKKTKEGGKKIEQPVKWTENTEATSEDSGTVRNGGAAKRAWTR